MSSQTVASRKEARPVTEKKAPPTRPTAVKEPQRPEERRGWDGSIVIKVDIFGNKWAST